MSKKGLVIAAVIVAVFTVAAAAAGLLPFWLAVVVAGAIWLKRGYGRARALIPLTEKGVPATATVIKKLRASSPSRKVHMVYAFDTASGRVEGRTEGVSRDLNHFAVGDSIEIVYLPDQPRVSAPQWVVEQARQARAELAARTAEDAARK